MSSCANESCIHSSVCMYYADRCITNGDCGDFKPPQPKRPHGEWVLCSDRLPKEDDTGGLKYYLVWYEYFRYGDYNKMFQTYGIAYFLYGRWGGDVLNGTGVRIIAWMPLPEPYKEKVMWRMTDSEKASLPDALSGECFHGEVWVRCPHCKHEIEMMGMLGKAIDKYKTYRIYQCPNCKGYFKDR